MYSTVHYSTIKYSTEQYQNYSTVQDVTSLVDTYLLIKLLVLGRLDKSLVGGGGGWHCNYSFKLQGSRGDLESLPLVELDSRPREN